MGFFSNIFGKQECSFCGNQVSVLNRDALVNKEGYICKDCSKKCSESVNIGRFTKQQVEEFSEKLSTVKNQYRKNIGYCRVSTSKQKDDLLRQCENIEIYLKALKQPYVIIKDIGSGINYNKKGLCELLELICKNKVDTIYVLYKDRLVRFGFEIIQKIAELHGTQIVVLDSEDKTKEQELVEDLMQIITVFSCRLHGKRASKTRKLMEELLKDDENG